MSVTGVIAEFNPFHKGHQLLIDQLHQSGDTVVCVISGNFVQRGDTAIIPKSKRAEAALRCGVDLVAELPVCWSMSTAQNFALGGVAQLMALGCERIAFGSECGDIDALTKTADVLSDKNLHERLSDKLSTGISFAKARQQVAEEMGAPAGLLEHANDTLAVEYILAARRLGFTGDFYAFARKGADHDSKEINPVAVSASLIREHLLTGDIGFAERFIPLALRRFIRPEMISDIARLETAVLSVLRTKTKEDFSALPDISEGLENKLLFSVQQATNLDELCMAIKTKRYSHARVRRLVLSAFLQIPCESFLQPPPYVRILGFSKSGENVLKSLQPTVPIITRATELKALDGFAKTVFETECRATDLYALSLQKPQSCGLEYKMKLLKTECL
ncbi:MAG: nucleotidyltransferase family protein [Clostridia bacterium]|nr:nucleotidyltransferase family protein [Clostridia bacterium]